MVLGGIIMKFAMMKHEKMLSGTVKKFLIFFSSSASIFRT